MGIHQITSAASPAIASPVEPKPAFGKLLQEARQLPGAGKPSGEVAPAVPPRAHPERAHAIRSASGAEATASRALERVSEAQQRLDRVLALAESGRTFTPAELLGLQAQVYSASQELDLAGKVVEKATSGIKQVLQTQL